MFSNKYKKDNEIVKLDEKFKKNLVEKIEREEKKVKRNSFKIASIVATVTVLLGGYFLINTGILDREKNIAVNDNVDNMEDKNKGQSQGTSMISFLNYKGNIYRKVQNVVDEKQLAEMKGEKLGVTVTGFNEEFASEIAGKEIYKVKGYEEKYFLMTTNINYENKIDIEFYQCYDDNEILKGEDILKILKLEGNIKKANSYESSGILKTENVKSEIEKLIKELKLSENILENKKEMKEFEKIKG
ncbi:MAG: hypothetical protein ACRDD2_10235, partial [Sarcina sp.]